METARVLGTNMVRLPEVALTLGRLLGEDVARWRGRHLNLPEAVFRKRLAARPLVLILGMGSFRCSSYWPRRWLATFSRHAFRPALPALGH